jgi:predicted nucleotidyltransferase
MSDIITECKNWTAKRLEEVRSEFEKEWPRLDPNTTIYVVGSAGRMEMSESSDLDPCIVTNVGSEPNNDGTAAASTTAHVKEILSALRKSIVAVGIPDLDANGKHAEPVTAASLVQDLGSPDDDSGGAMSKRILLLLESKPLVHSVAYDRLKYACIQAYWKNEESHKDDYLPIVLVNDIVRYWRTVLLNHESRIREKLAKDVSGKANELALRRYSSFKLRIPRCLSCFSALLYLLHSTSNDKSSVTPDQVVTMVEMTPLERLASLVGTSTTVDEMVKSARQLYLKYLEISGKGKEDLLGALAKPEDPLTYEIAKCGNVFSEIIFKLVQEIGGGRRLHRAIVV